MHRNEGIVNILIDKKIPNFNNQLSQYLESTNEAKLRNYKA